MSQESIYEDRELKESSGSGALWRIIKILAIILLALMIWAALWSFTPDDPALTRAAGKALSSNWIGPVGADLAHALFQFLGFAAWFLPVAIGFTAFFSMNCCEMDKRDHVGYWSGWGLVTISTSVFFAIFADSSNPFIQSILGIFLANLANNWFGKVGTIFVFCFIFLVGLLILFQYAVPVIKRLSSMPALQKLMDFFSIKWEITQEANEVSQMAQETNEITKNEPSIPLTPSGTEKNNSEPVIKSPRKAAPKPVPDAKDEDSMSAMTATALSGDFKLPGISFLADPVHEATAIDRELYLSNAHVLEQKLLDFAVAGKVVEISPGPVVTMYEFAPAPGVKINKVSSLADDLALALKTQSVRIVAPIPGKAVIGIELANQTRQMVYLKEILSSDVFQKHKGGLPLALGQDISGLPVAADLAKMPHLLIAGSTGTGKSVGLNAMLISLLYKHSPNTLRLLMVDPKRIELSLYDGIPHLLHPVVSEPKEATRALRWAVGEMERRYKLLEEHHARNLHGYNEIAEEKLPYLVIIIDELSDLMMVSSKEVETAIARLAQMARAAGIHLLIATQRPSVDVLTGLIKANFPARISFKVASKVDSRTILDQMGADRLLGMGDMLFLPPGSASLQRIHGAYISEKEILAIVEFLKAQGEPEYDQTVMEATANSEESADASDGDGDGIDKLYSEAVKVVRQSGQVSISMLQRRLRVGYNRSARMIERMEEEGIITPPDHTGKRQVLD